MSVDLPAPFSPTMPWIVPRRTTSETSRLAWTRPNDLSMPRSSRAGVERSASIIASGATSSMIALVGLIYDFLKSQRQDSATPVFHSGIVTVDEVDAHMHPLWQHELVCYTHPRTGATVERMAFATWLHLSDRNPSRLNSGFLW